MMLSVVVIELCAPHRRRSELLAILDTNQICWVMGITELHEHIYVVTFTSNRISVFGAQPLFARLPNIGLPTMKDPWAIAASPPTNHLYVADWKLKCIWRVKINDTITIPSSPSDDGKKSAHTFTKWNALEGGPWWLTVDKTGCVLVVDVIKGNMTVYSREGEPLDVVSFYDVGLENPQHAIRTTADTYIVSHGWELSKFHGVCEIDRNGSILNICVGRPGEFFINPDELARGADERKILVVDARGVQVLDRRLRFERVLLRPPPEARPSRPTGRRLCYLEKSGHLLVSWGERFIHAYRF